MKNIHVLPTDKPSRTYKIDSIGKLDWSEGYLHQVDGATNQNIYITSDEEIKEGDYTYHKTFGVGKIININGEDCFVTIKLNPKDGSITTPWKRNIPDIKKIILTTDQDLIADGVQAIDDEFLQWFVKNPSCEEVEVEIESKFDRVDGHYHDVWEIIIPKEEPKQSIIKTEEDAKIFIEALENIPEPNEKLKKAFKDFHKQETLEEATKIFLNTRQEFYFRKDSLLWNYLIKISQFGAKWQQEQDKNKYSEEEAKHLMTLAFEQGFKKADVVEAGLEAKETDTEVNWIFLKHKK
jgi:hypothetical protein